MLHGNYIDLFIVLIVAFYVLEGIKRGFWALVGDLASFFGSIFLAFRLYPLASKFLIANFTLPHSFANAIGFIAVAFLAQTLVSMLVFRVLATALPKKLLNAYWTRLAAVLPAILDSLVLISIGLTLIISLPVNPKIKVDIQGSKLGGPLLSRTQKIESALSSVFGDAIAEGINFITVRPESGEKVDIPYKPKKLSVDEVSEGRMLELVNAERAKVGAKPLKVDSTIVLVARAHSQDMWERGYFSHANPDGESPADRMARGGVKFIVAGENLALAPTVETAHEGLMNSPGHKRNILDPQFGRIGIGVIDGGIYGKMWTQNFAD
ncbi:MAG: CvpA family protein [Patescibacteria group bacterium]|mgnify:CR=1 FL=1